GRLPAGRRAWDPARDRARAQPRLRGLRRADPATDALDSRDLLVASRAHLVRDRHAVLDLPHLAGVVLRSAHQHRSGREVRGSDSDARGAFAGRERALDSVYGDLARGVSVDPFRTADRP